MDGNEKGGENETVCFRLDGLSPAIYNKITKLGNDKLYFEIYYYY